MIQDYNTNVAPNAFRSAVDDLFSLLDEENQKYFRESREERFNKKFEEISGDRETNIQQYYAGLKKIDDVLSTTKFLNGDKPLIHDYILASRIQFFRTVSPRAYEELILNNPNENFKRWTKDMDKVLNGYLGKRPTL